MSTKTELEWRLVAKDAASKKVRAVDRAFESLRKGAKATKDALKGVLTIGVAGGAAAGGTLAYLLKQTADELDRLGKSATRLGVGTDSLAAFQLAAKLSGVEVNTLELSLQRMVRRIGDANRGFGEAQKAFAELGLDARELARLRPEEQFIRIKSALEEIENVNQRLSTGAQIFDSEGIKTLQISIDTLRQSVGDVQKSGLAVTREEVARVEAANDAVTRLDNAWLGVKSTLATQVAPEVEGVVDELREFLQELSKDDVRSSAWAIADAFFATTDAIQLSIQYFKLLQLGVERSASKIAHGARIIGNGLAFWKDDSERDRAIDEGNQRNQWIERDIREAFREIAEIQEAQERRSAARQKKRIDREREITEVVKERVEQLEKESRAQDLASRPINLDIPDIRSSLEILQEERDRQRREWGETFLEIFSLARDRGVEMWEQIGEAARKSIEKIREEQRRQHEEARQKLLEQRYFYQAIGDTVRYGVVDAIERAIDGTGEWSEALRETLLDLRRLFLDQLLRGIIGNAVQGTGVFGLFGLSPVQSALGNVFSGGDVQPFARGGIVNGPTVFPMARGGIGLMGEAGPEAIMPLMRGRGGKLGVEATGGAGVTNVNLSISAVDAPSFVRLLNSPDGQRWFQATFGRMQQRRIA